MSTLKTLERFLFLTIPHRICCRGSNPRRHRRGQTEGAARIGSFPFVTPRGSSRYRKCRRGRSNQGNW